MGKAITLGLVFGMTAEGLRREVRTRLGVAISETEAVGYREAFFAAYPRIHEWQQEVRRERRTESRSLCGRRPRSAPVSVSERRSRA